ncbi:hypothetical protein M6B38_340975 [Iris pallida]|uniref:Uncharacterized protein n=1 Tax=Iris pallida TaxID=29817 RepID=A0AAX6GY90_IRIPA|nr:hypothetical protein M6B38_340975 [Iris pallida]
MAPIGSDFSFPSARSSLEWFILA